MGENVIKVRDDHTPVRFIKADSDDSNDYRFKQLGEKKADDSIGNTEFRI